MTNAIQRAAKIINLKGLHARASAKLAALALKLPTPVTVEFEGETADARSIMDLLCLGAGIGSTVQLKAAGSGAKEAIAAVQTLIADGFGELEDDKACSCK